MHLDISLKTQLVSVDNYLYRITKEFDVLRGEYNELKGWSLPKLYVLLTISGTYRAVNPFTTAKPPVKSHGFE